VATDDDELLSAYLDGVAELTPDERRRVEEQLANDPVLRGEADDLRGLIERTRALPASMSTSEPDWSALERQIREAVGPTVPVPFWRRLRWLAPVGTLVTTAAIALLWLHHAPTDHTAVVHDAGSLAIAVPSTPAAPTAPVAEPAAPTAAVYIDGQVIDISNVDPEALMNDMDGTSDDTAESDTGLLPATDYGWLDQLDDKAMERAERWLARKHGG
jgi:anti-sigma factor RsiW